MLYVNTLYAVVILLLFCCYSVVILLLFCCYSVVILLLFCCYSVVILLLFCCYFVVAILLLFDGMVWNIIYHFCRFFQFENSTKSKSRLKISPHTGRSSAGAFTCTSQPMRAAPRALCRTFLILFLAWYKLHKSTFYTLRNTVVLTSSHQRQPTRTYYHTMVVFPR